MRSFAQTLALAGILAHTTWATCTLNSDGDDSFCTGATGIATAMSDYAGNYSWTLEPVTTADGYDLQMIRFMGDSNGDRLLVRDSNGDPVRTDVNGDPVTSDGNGNYLDKDDAVIMVADTLTTELQNRRHAVLMTHSSTKDCVNWLDASTPAADSIPKLLFDKGYDVFLGCRRGTEYSRTKTGLDLATSEGLEMYFNYNTQTVGEGDVPAMVARAVAIHAADLDINMAPNNCADAQILTHGLGSAEALAAFSLNPMVDNVGAVTEPISDIVTQVISLAPCPVKTFKQASDSTRLLSALADKQMVDEPRELSVIVEEDMPQRELSHWGYNNYYRSYWDRTEAYCNRYPDSCYKYCDWYPYYCDAFCKRFPQFCVPDAVRNNSNEQKIYKDLDIYSFYGPNWADQVTAICQRVSTADCTDLMASVNAGKKEVGVQQLQHMWQTSYTKEFVQYDPDFNTTGWLAEDYPNIDVTTITTPFKNVFTADDQLCANDLNLAVFAMLSGDQQPYYTTMTNEDHRSILTAGENEGLMDLLYATLADGITCADY